MRIDLQDKAVELARSLATDGKDAADVITEALARMAWEREEVAAVMRGVADHQAGRVRPYEEFAAELLGEAGLTPERRTTV